MMPSLCLSQLCQQNKIIQQVNHEIAVCVDEGSRDACRTSRSPAYFSFSPSLCDCSPAHMSRTLPPAEGHSSLGCSSESPLGRPGELTPSGSLRRVPLLPPPAREHGACFQEEKCIHFSAPSPECRGLTGSFCCNSVLLWRKTDRVAVLREGAAIWTRLGHLHKTAHSSSS